MYVWHGYILTISWHHNVSPILNGQELSCQRNIIKSIYSPRNAMSFTVSSLLAKPPPTSAHEPKSYSKRIKDLMDRLGRTSKFAMPSTSVVSPLNAPVKPGFSKG